MDYFLRSRGQSHELTDAELIANSDLLMVAGSETTATLLSGVTYWLLRTPHALKRATEEVRNAFDSEDSITFNGVRAKLPYMSACLEEALRLFPPVPLSLSRTVPKGPPVQIAGLTIPEKVKFYTINMCPIPRRISNIISYRLLLASIICQPIIPSLTSTERRNSSRNAGYPNLQQIRPRLSITIAVMLTAHSGANPFSTPDEVITNLWILASARATVLEGI